MPYLCRLLTSLVLSFFQHSLSLPFMKFALMLFSSVLLLNAGCGADNVSPTPPDETSAPPAVLDLSRDHLPDEMDDGEIGEDAALLPDLLGNESDAGKVKLSGGVITDKEAATLMDKIEGAEVKLEVKTP